VGQGPPYTLIGPAFRNWVRQDKMSQ
jgi:hypothetical protein